MFSAILAYKCRAVSYIHKLTVFFARIEMKSPKITWFNNKWQFWNGKTFRFPKVPDFWKFERLLPVLQSFIGWALEVSLIQHQFYRSLITMWFYISNFLPQNFPRLNILNPTFALELLQIPTMTSLQGESNFDRPLSSDNERVVFFYFSQKQK